MGSKFPILSSREIIKALGQAKFEKISQRGSHVKFSNGTRICIVPMHDEVARGTLKAILEQADLTLDEFMELL